jgi:hypothetical protein
MPYKYVTAEVEVDLEEVLEELDTDELIEELERRGVDYNTNGVDGDEMREVLDQIWQKRRIGQDYQAQLDKLIYGVLGKVI